MEELLKGGLSIVIVLLGLFNWFEVNGQRKGGRDTGPPPAQTPSPSRPKVRHPPEPMRSGDLIISVPPGCRVWIGDSEVALQTSAKLLPLNGQNVKTLYAADTGILTIKNLKPGSYRITGRKPEFYEYMETVELAGENHSSYIELKPICGTLTIRPSVAGTEVEVIDLDSNSSLGRYPDRLERLEVPPGRYRVSVSREGYRSNVREVSIKSGDSIFLEPVIEKLAPPVRRPQLPRIPATFSVSNDGKYTVVTIISATGETDSDSGTISIRYGVNLGNLITGSLNGLPCQIEFVKLENISVGSPGTELEFAL